MVYLPMSYLYGVRYAIDENPLIISLRSVSPTSLMHIRTEVYLGTIHRILLFNRLLIQSERYCSSRSLLSSHNTLRHIDSLRQHVRIYCTFFHHPLRPPLEGSGQDTLSYQSRRREHFISGYRARIKDVKFHLTISRRRRQFRALDPV